MPTALIIEASPTEPSLPPRRSVFATALAWTIIVLSALLIPISTLSLLMLIAKSYGTASATVLGFLGVVVAPPVTFVAGIGRLRRWKWAWLYVLLLLGLFHRQRRLGTPVSPSRNDDLHLCFRRADHDPDFIWLQLPSPAHRADLRRAAGEAPFTVGSLGVFGLTKVERPASRAHHVIYFPSPVGWQNYPEWACHRREEIVGRIKSEFRPPDYENQDNGAGGSAPPA